MRAPPASSDRGGGRPYATAWWESLRVAPGALVHPTARLEAGVTEVNLGPDGAWDDLAATWLDRHPPDEAGPLAEVTRAAIALRQRHPDGSLRPGPVRLCNMTGIRRHAETNNLRVDGGISFFSRL